MSEQIHTVELEGATLTLTSFAGGEKRGTCVQITVTEPNGRASFIQMPWNDVARLTLALLQWQAQHLEPKWKGKQ